MGNYKWNVNDSDITKPYVVVLMTSRNKDNQDVPNFKARRKAKFCTLNEEKIYKEFEFFASQGVPGGNESCLYFSECSRPAKGT